MATESIPANQVVDVIPSVLSAGGSALDVVGLILSTAARVPIGEVQSFASAADVADYFGSGSTEAALADIYFRGYDGRSVTPDAILFAQYNTAAVGGFLRGGDLSSMTLTQLQALSGVLILTVGGVVKTSSTINLSGASSFSNAATLIQAAFTSPGFTVSYDSVSGGFLFTNTATGASSTLTYATGSLAAGLLLGSTNGAALSQGAVAADPQTFMDGILDITQNWVNFMLAFNPDTGGANTVKLAFAEWTNDQDNEFGFVCWDDDTAPTASSNAAASLGRLIADATLSGTCLVYAPDAAIAAFVCGTAASINFERLNGRITFKFRQLSGIVPSVTNATVANNLASNGYNFYGAYATRNQAFNFFANGVVSGKFKWFDSYINQIWLNNALQLAILTGMTNVGSIPYNSSGYSLIEAFCMDPILAGLNFGAIRRGVTLSAAQVAQVNEAAGAIIAPTLQTRGWYLQILDATAQVRANRGSPPCTFWYMDGGSVQKIDLASIEVQ